MHDKQDKYPLIDLRRVKRYAISERLNKTRISELGKPITSKKVSREFFASLPRFLKARELNEFMALVIKARRNRLPFHLLMGAHVIKVGLAPVIIDLMKQKIVTGVSFNGAGLIHDMELAFFGGTSEDVQSGLADGSFGMVRETGELFSEVVKLAVQQDMGLGEAGGFYINRVKAPHRRVSIFAAAEKMNIPVTVHIGIGTDIVNQHPDFDASMAAEASYKDFRLLAAICSRIDRGGVVANIGSAVILPEVFLKALTVARNVNPGKSRLTTANFDMLEHYRPRVNIVSRPTNKIGRGFDFRGHHEIMIPLLAWGLKAGFKS